MAAPGGFGPLYGERRGVDPCHRFGGATILPCLDQVLFQFGPHFGCDPPFDPGGTPGTLAIGRDRID